jgi:hypothetical protein
LAFIFERIKAFFERDAIASDEKNNDDAAKKGPKTPVLLIVNTA